MLKWLILVLFFSITAQAAVSKQKGQKAPKKDPIQCTSTCNCKCKCGEPAPTPDPTPDPTPPPAFSKLDFGSDETLQIHTIGDSITNNPGWRTQLYNSLVKKKLKVDFIGSLTDEYPRSPEPQNDGHSFFTTSDVLRDIDGWFGKILKPELTILMIGTNDIAWWITEDETAIVTRLSQIIDKVEKNSPSGHVIVASIPPEGSADLPTTIKPNARDRVKAVNRLNGFISDLVKIRANRGEPIHFVDIFSSLGLEDLNADGIHPTDAGQVKMGDAFYNGILPLLPDGPQPPPPLPERTMKVEGDKLKDACGQNVIIRGVNQMTVWTDWIDTPRDGLPMFTEIAKTKANSVRIVWSMKDASNVPQITAAQLDAAISNAVANKMIPIVGLWDYTCQWSDAILDEVTKWWTSPEILSVIKKHQRYLIVNVGNELGYIGIDSATFIKGYSRVVPALRLAGIHVPLMIDTGSCAQDEVLLAAVAPAIIKADPDSNIIFGLHIWWDDQSVSRIEKAVTALTNLKVPFVIAEFASVAVDCKTPIMYKDIIRVAQEKGIGYMPWSWDNQSQCATHAMTKDNAMSYSTLWGWGLEVMVSDPNSVANTSVLSTCLMKK